MIGLRDVGIALAVSRTTPARRARRVAVRHGRLRRRLGRAGHARAAGGLGRAARADDRARREGHRFRTEHRDLATTVVSQTAVAVKKIQLLERLSERNLTKDFFDDLAARRRAVAVEARARRLRCDLTAAARRAVGGGAGRRPATGLGRRPRGVAGGGVPRRADRALRHACAGAAAGVGRRCARARAAGAARRGAVRVIGLSSVCSGAAAFPTGFGEALQSVRGAAVVRPTPGVVTYEELGPYKYLLRLAPEPGQRDHHRDALRPLLEYDAQHRSQLFRTLEEYLRQRGRVASTAAALYVHPNTLRQRLARIETITGLDLRPRTR